MSNIEDTKPIDVLAARVWSGTHYHYPHIEKMTDELRDLREQVSLLESRRGGECDTCNGWVCPPLRCAACMMAKRITPESDPGPLAADVIRTQDAELTRLRTALAAARSSVTIPVAESERMPCARCGVPVAEEFVIPNDVWNPIIRGATGERDDEFICLECWWNAVRKYVAASQQTVKVLTDALDKMVNAPGGDGDEWWFKDIARSALRAADARRAVEGVKPPC